MAEVADKPPPSGLTRQADNTKPHWLISRTFFKAGATVSEEVTTSVDDVSLIRNGIAQQNLDVMMLRWRDYLTTRLSGIDTRGDAKPHHQQSWSEPMPFETPRDHAAVYLSAGIEYSEIRRMVAASRTPQKKDQEAQRVPQGLKRQMNGEKGGLMPEGMRFIDCQSDLVKVIAAPTAEVEFVALSYVWGQPEADSDTNTTTDPSVIPQTIVDAMSVVRELGLRYLWVDKYCIEDGNRHIMISQMDKIYKTATLTIVAACGHNPFHELPGVSRSRHHKSHPGYHRIWHPGAFLAFLAVQDPATEIRTSRWSTRGWTYQEGLFSPHCLIFTPTQWILTHGDVSYREYRPIRHDWTPFPKFNKDPEAYIFEVINSYATRDLTYPSDSLTAFLGVLNNWQSPTWSHLSGIPFGGKEFLGWFPPSNNFLFLRGLFWGCLQANLSRVPSIPSWTWAGWRGFKEKDLPFTRSSLRNWPGMSMDIDVQIHTDKTYNLRDYHLFIPMINGNNEKGDVVTTIQLTGWSVRLDIESLSKLEVQWNSLEFRDQHKDGPLAIIVLYWSWWSDDPWKALVVGKKPGTDDLYNRLGRLLWHEPSGVRPESVVIEGRCLVRRSFTLV